MLQVSDFVRTGDSGPYFPVLFVNSCRQCIHSNNIEMREASSKRVFVPKQGTLHVLKLLIRLKKTRVLFVHF